MGQRKLLGFLIVFFGCTVSGWTQNAPAWELFGGYSGKNAEMREYFHQTPIIYKSRDRYTTMSGFEFSVTENKNRHFGGTFDFSAYFKNPQIGDVKNRQRSLSVLYGPRLSTGLGFSHLKGFAHVLLGVDYEQVGVTPVGPHDSALSFAFAAGGGFDLQIEKRTSIRLLQVDYFRRSNAISAEPHGVRASAGLVWNLGELK